MSAILDRSTARGANNSFAYKLGADELLEALLPVGIARFDAGKRLMESNAQFATLLGLPIDLIEEGMTFDELVMAIRIRKSASDRGSTGLLLMDGAVASQPRQIERALPGGRWVRLHIAPLADGGMLYSGLDMTAERQLVSERQSHQAVRAKLQESESKLEQSHLRQEQASRELFLSDMAQELRTPLSVICGLLQLTQLNQLPTAQAGHLAKVHEAARELQMRVGERLAALEQPAHHEHAGTNHLTDWRADWTPPNPANDACAPVQNMADLGPRPLAGMKILLAEDEESNQFVARELLSSLGASVEIAVDGLDALGWLVAGERFDAIVMDWHMPNMNGLDATREIRRMVGFEGMPIIALSTNATWADRQACLDVGMNEHVCKAVHPEALVRALLVHARGMALAPASDGEHAERQTLPQELPTLELVAGPLIHPRTASIRQSSDPALYNQVAGLFRSDAARVMREMAEAVRLGQRSHVARIAHTFNCFADSLGATPLAHAADNVEELFRGTVTDSDCAAIKQLEDAVNQVLESLACPWDQVGAR